MSINDNNGDSLWMLKYDVGGGRETTLSVGVASISWVVTCMAAHKKLRLKLIKLRLHIEYACTVWAPYTACDIALLDIILPDGLKCLRDYRDKLTSCRLHFQIMREDCCSYCSSYAPTKSNTMVITINIICDIFRDRTYCVCPLLRCLTCCNGRISGRSILDCFIV